jgi:hypothetical protein
MSPEEAKGLAKWIAKLFTGQVTAEQAKLLRDELLPFGLAAAKEAIKNHRTSHEFLSIPQLLEGCRAAERGATSQPTSTTQREGSRADVYRRQNPRLAACATDLEVVLRVARIQWHASRQRPSYRSKIETELRNDEAMRALPDEVPDAWTAYVFEASAGDFDLALEDLRSVGAVVGATA